jgi:hypothetical protein
LSKKFKVLVEKWQIFFFLHKLERICDRIFSFQCFLGHPPGEKKKKHSSTKENIEN